MCRTGTCSEGVCKRGTVVLFGGFTLPTHADSNDTWTFDGTRWTQLSVSNAPPARSFAAMATLGNEVVLFGGAAIGFLNDTWMFDGTSWTQVSVSP
jgi:hypothetical protein